MNKFIRLLSALILVAINYNVYASGQRTAVITSETIEKYHAFTLHADDIPEPKLHYIGTVSGNRHLLMVTKTAHSKRSDGRHGMPWDRVFSYTISGEELEVVNGWDIGDKLKEGELKVRPSYCPKLYISEKQKRYTIRKHPDVKMACLEMRQPKIW